MLNSECLESEESVESINTEDNLLKVVHLLQDLISKDKDLKEAHSEESSTNLEDENSRTGLESTSQRSRDSNTRAVVSLEGKQNFFSEKHLSESTSNEDNDTSQESTLSQQLTVKDERSPTTATEEGSLAWNLLQSSKTDFPEHLPLTGHYETAGKKPHSALNLVPEDDSNSFEDENSSAASQSEILLEVNAQLYKKLNPNSQSQNAIEKKCRISKDSTLDNQSDFKSELKILISETSNPNSESLGTKSQNSEKSTLDGQSPFTSELKIQISRDSEFDCQSYNILEIRSSPLKGQSKTEFDPKEQYEKLVENSSVVSQASGSRKSSSNIKESKSRKYIVTNQPTLSRKSSNRNQESTSRKSFATNQLTLSRISSDQYKDSPTKKEASSINGSILAEDDQLKSPSIVSEKKLLTLAQASESKNLKTSENTSRKSSDQGKDSQTKTEALSKRDSNPDKQNQSINSERKLVQIIQPSASRNLSKSSQESSRKESKTSLQNDLLSEKCDNGKKIWS